MALSFAELKKSSKDNPIEKLSSELAKLNSQTYQDNDNRFWYPDVDKSGNGYAVVRFLPPAKDEDHFFVKIFNHYFQGPTGSWLIENCPTTLGKPCPICEHNSKLWNSGFDKDKDVARNQKRRLTFISNVYVIKDSLKPENEGKVFLFKYGKKIFDMLNDQMNPKFEDEVAVNPFDFWGGANFKFKIRTVEKYRNYDKSEFEKPSPLSTDDQELERIWAQEHKLSEFLAENQFKTVDILKTRLDRILGLTGHAQSAMLKKAEDKDLSSAKSTTEKEEPSIPSTDDDGDDEYQNMLAQYQSLADKKED